MKNKLYPLALGLSLLGAHEVSSADIGASLMPIFSSRANNDVLRAQLNCRLPINIHNSTVIDFKQNRKNGYSGLTTLHKNLLGNIDLRGDIIYKGNGSNEYGLGLRFSGKRWSAFFLPLNFVPRKGFDQGYSGISFGKKFIFNRDFIKEIEANISSKWKNTTDNLEWDYGEIKIGITLGEIENLTFKASYHPALRSGKSENKRFWFRDFENRFSLEASLR